MTARSAALLLTIDNRLDTILKFWLLLAGLASAARILLSPHPAGSPALTTFASYMLLVVAPFVSTLLALRWFRDGHLQAQPATRLARVGRWTGVSRRDAERHALYGTSGIMVSLLVGMMLNVPVRALEYMAAMPPLPVGAPAWLSSLHFAMTLDVVLFGSLYMIAFVAALRRVPLFPRLLAAIWIGDLAMQLFTAELVTRAGDLPPAVAGALHGLLEGNVKKVLISVALWLPYLLLSRRVNVTYRHRIPA
ncbi:MAG TPA: DUF2569 domain-containing protein [Sphingomicrobium sp.]|nr:DUF2569 domain-containing protein [Sphingomicrobium sp.]